jgi:carbonic anhydrase
MQSNVIDQVSNLRDLDPILHKKYKNGEILIVGAFMTFTLKSRILQETPLILPQLKK